MSHPIPDAPTGVDASAWTAAIAAVRAYCGWHIAPEVTETVTLNGPGGDLAWVPTQRLVDVADVTSDGVVVLDPQWSTGGLVRLDSQRWSTRLRGVEMTVTHGLEEWPPEVLAIAKELASGADRGGVSSVTNRGHQVSFEAPMSERQTLALDPYRLVVFA